MFHLSNKSKTLGLLVRRVCQIPRSRRGEAFGRKSLIPLPDFMSECFALTKICKYTIFSLVLLVETFPPLPQQFNPNYVLAHEVEVSGDVAATFHLEPNHNPRAGATAKIWFALTRRGGQIIPLEQCNCKLAIYPKGYKQGDKPLMEPPLTVVSAERYKGIPGADIVFPKAGIYELKFSGSAKTAANFKPFELTYTVTVR